MLSFISHIRTRYLNNLWRFHVVLKHGTRSIVTQHEQLIDIAHKHMFVSHLEACFLSVVYT